MIIVASQCFPTAQSCGDLTTRPTVSCSDTWDTYANDFFEVNCRGCHHPMGGLFTNAPDILQTPDDVRAHTEMIRLVIDFQQMPPGPATLSPAERRRLLTWLACGAN
jgi:hypothetical protein